MSKNSYIIIVLAILLIGIFIGIFIYAFSVKSEPVTSINNPISVPSIMPLPTSGQPQMNLKPNTQYQAVLNTTAGNITVSLFADKTPITANNFIYLSRKGFYNNTIFHRVLKGFMIQGGDPTGNGTGGPGYKFDDESFSGEYTRGTLAMANAGPNTNGSQFFIMHQNYNLPKNYVIFGKVISGMEIVDKIAEAPVTTSDSGENSKPVTPVKINSVEIIENTLPLPSSTIAP